jgi:hypothetical protein
VILALVGGFLGAGKTTLLTAAARFLQTRGLKAALITNDQGGELVDSRMAAAMGTPSEEVAGACFCCRFTDFASAAERLMERSPDIVFAEPVGSCTDLSATVLQPLKREYRARFDLAPYTVLVDPVRARELLAPDADPDLKFLFEAQVAEADLLVFTKSDLNTEFPSLGRPARRLSAKTGEGIADWLDSLLSGNTPAGSRILDIDYERYARAEAALGWLNWRAQLDLRRAARPAEVAGPLLENMDAALTARGIPIAHLKVFVAARTGWVKASVCRNGDEPGVDGDVISRPARRHDIVLNLRARGEPEALEQVVEASLEALPGKLAVTHREAFRPAAPNPERRIGEVAE